MKKNIPGLVVAAACGFCVSTAEAAPIILAEWPGGGNPTYYDTGVASVSPNAAGYTYQFVASDNGTGSTTFSIQLNPGYAATGVTANFTYALNYNTSVTIEGVGPTAIGGDYSSAPFDIAQNGSANFTIAVTENDANTVNFTDVNFRGTITAVPEPTALALFGFGLIFAAGAVPGLTGLWQVRGKNRTTFNQMVGFDIDYSERSCLWLDLAIIAKTPSAIWAQIRESLQSGKLAAVPPSGMLAKPAEFYNIHKVKNGVCAYWKPQPHSCLLEQFQL